MVERDTRKWGTCMEEKGTPQEVLPSKMMGSKNFRRGKWKNEQPKPVVKIKVRGHDAGESWKKMILGFIPLSPQRKKRAKSKEK